MCAPPLRCRNGVGAAQVANVKRLLADDFSDDQALVDVAGLFLKDPGLRSAAVSIYNKLTAKEEPTKSPAAKVVFGVLFGYAANRGDVLADHVPALPTSPADLDILAAIIDRVSGMPIGEHSPNLLELDHLLETLTAAQNGTL